VGEHPITFAPDRFTWLYVSVCLVLTVFFKFSRLLSLRNWDLVTLLAPAPALLLRGYHPAFAFAWLFGCAGYFMLRLLVDAALERKPSLGCNLSNGGMACMLVSTCVLTLLWGVLNPPSALDRSALREANQLLHAQLPAPRVTEAAYGPGFPIVMVPFVAASEYLIAGDISRAWSANDLATLTIAVVSHSAVVLALLLIGHRHFGSLATGAAMAALYMLLPYVLLVGSQPSQTVPVALVVWAVAACRMPVVAGALLGLAAAVLYFPVFLVPVWVGFYWRRGAGRFVLAFALVLGAFLGLMVSDHARGLVHAAFGPGDWWRLPPLHPSESFWATNEAVYRVPIAVAFAAISLGLAFWPVQKHLGHLAAASAIVILGYQFWYAYGGGTYVLWYLPLLIVTTFRPTLTYRVELGAAA
jgi:hypothetical protein